MRLLSKLSTWENKPGVSAAAARAMLRLPVENAIRHFGLNFQVGTSTGNKKLSDMVDEIRLTLNTKRIWEVLASQLEAILAINGVPFQTQSAAGQPYFFRLPFSRAWLRTWVDEDQIAIGTGDLESILLEFFVKASLTEAPSFDGHYEFDNAYDAGGKPLPSGMMVHYRRRTLSPTSSGTMTVNDLQKLRYMRLYLFTDKVNWVTVKLNDRDIFEEVSKVQLDRLIVQAGGTPSSTVCCIPFDLLSQRIADYLDTRGASSFRLDINHASGVAAYEVVSEFLADKNGD